VAFGLTVAWVLGVGGIWVHDGLGSRGWDFLVAFGLTVAWVLVSAWWWSRGFAVGLGLPWVLGEHREEENRNEEREKKNEEREKNNKIK
jgi:hypothetical protein